MASLLNNASLLLNPAGSIISYQEDKIYSVLPKDGTGDFTFSGGDGGTRVNQDGYIERTPVNLLLSSEFFSSLIWNYEGGSISGGFTDPLGGNTAYKYIPVGSAGLWSNIRMPEAGQITLSWWGKSVSGANVTAYIGDGVSVGGGTRTYTSQWQFYTASLTTTSAGGFYLYSFSDPTSGLYIWHPQLNYGSLRPYQPTTDRLNYPRITYQNGRGALLQEPQRTNVTTNSQTISAGTGTTVSLNSGISPDGTQNADKLIEDTSTGTHITTFGGSLGGSVDSSTFCVSIFAKAAERTRFVIFDNNQGAGAAINVFDVSNGTKISGNGTIESYRDGWYRCIIFPSKTDNTTANIQIRLINTGTNDSYTGDGSSGMFFWGKQIETGEFASTYIPTTSATVTRPLDEFFKNDSPALNTTSWTFYMSGVNIGKNQNVSNNNIDNVNWSFDSGAGPYGPNSLHNYNNTVYYYDTVNGPANLGDIGSTTTKFAVTKNGTTFKLFRNGVLFSTNTLSLASNVWDSFRMYGLTDAQGQAYSNNPSTVAILPSALSDADAQSLTTVRSGSGGTISYYGPYTIHTFTGSATFTPSFSGEVEVLVVAGGGGGGQNHGGGGGGAGGLLYASSYGVAAGSGITVTVGSGGSVAGAGSNSVFGGLTAIGGGYGASEGPNNGGNGGSGGGGTGFSTATSGGLGTPGQGFDGGKGAYPDTSGVYGSGGGGGGASAPGTDGKEGQNVSGSAGNGGNGLPYSITGFSTYYAGGGGGGYWGDNLAYYGVGGLGGGGNGGAGGSSSTLLPTPGVNGLGGGGGGSRGDGSLPRPGSTGGSGIVIVRYLT